MEGKKGGQTNRDTWCQKRRISYFWFLIWRLQSKRRRRQRKTTMTILSTTTVLLRSTSFYRTSPADLSPTRTDPLRIRHRDWHFFDPGLIHMAKIFSTIIDLLQNNVSSFFHEFWRGGLQRPKFKAICVVPISAFAGVGSSFQWKTHFQQNFNSAPICWKFLKIFFHNSIIL